MITDNTPVEQTFELSVGSALTELVRVIVEREVAALKDVIVALSVRIDELESSMSDEIEKRVDDALGNLSVELTRR